MNKIAATRDRRRVFGLFDKVENWMGDEKIVIKNTRRKTVRCNSRAHAVIIIHITKVHQQRYCVYAVEHPLEYNIS